MLGLTLRRDEPNRVPSRGREPATGLSSSFPHLIHLDINSYVRLSTLVNIKDMIYDGCLGKQGSVLNCKTHTGLLYEATSYAQSLLVEKVLNR